MANFKKWLPKILLDLFAWIFGSDDKDHRIGKIPIRLLGFKDMPAVPLSLRELPGTLISLSEREKALEQAKNGLTSKYTIGGETANAYSFMFSSAGKSAARKAREGLQEKVGGLSMLKFMKDKMAEEHLDNEEVGGVEEEVHPLNTLSLDTPEQYGMSWTNYFDLHEEFSKEHLKQYSATLTSADAATKAFFPMIAENGMAYNLIITKRVESKQAAEFKATLGKNWTNKMEDAASSGHLYVIDMRIFEKFEPQMRDKIPTFTPSTLTFLEQNSETKNLIPIAVRVTAANGDNERFYHRNSTTDWAWLYALQAAKVSITVYGIWLGHVYHWHMVTAALQMTMHNNFLTDKERDSDLYKFVAPQSNYLIAFDDVLLFLWKHTAPPTSIVKGSQFLALCNHFATGREYFDDDPNVTLAAMGIEKKNFTVKKDWDKFPIVRNFLEIWDATKKYVDVFVDVSFADDAAVKNDAGLQKWIDASRDEKDGNVNGLPKMDSRENLKRFLRSFIYRITAHGCSRMNKAANPALTFVGNYPPTLQRTDIPAPDADPKNGTKELLTYLPNTGTIGKTAMFYFTFIFSAPYEPLIPLKGFEEDLTFPGRMDDKRNVALVNFRKDIAAFIERFDTESPIVHQWPLNIET